MAASTMDMAFDPALALARQTLYRFFSFALMDPRVGVWETLHALPGQSLLADAAELIRTQPAANPATLAPGERPLDNLNPAAVLAQIPNTPEELNHRYEDTFGLLVTNASPPYETEYIPEKLTFQRSNALADIAGYYRAFGFQVSPHHPERPDHLALELEFMASVIHLELLANSDPPSQRDARQSVCREAQARFFRDHLAWWAPAFTRLMTRERSDGFYPEVAKMLAAFIPAERGLLGVAATSAAVEPQPIDRPDACAGCGVVAL